MNIWNPASASCDAPEDKAEGLQDIGFHSGGGAGKLSYRNLIFGSTGRKANRPISERTRAAESLFLVPNDDEDAIPTVMYANSSSFVSRGRNSASADEGDRMSVLDLMSHSNLWNELKSAAQPFVDRAAGVDLVAMRNRGSFSCYTYQTLPVEVRGSTRELILRVLGDRTLSSDDIIREAKTLQAENIPGSLALARPFCTTTVVVTALCELAKEGSVECLQKMGPNWSIKDWDPRYRRAKVRIAVEPKSKHQAAAKQHQAASRCMKIAKPWKRARML